MRMCVCGFTEGKEKWKADLFGERIAEKFPNFGNDYEHADKQFHRTSSRQDQKIFSLWHVIVRLSKVRENSENKHKKY